MTQAGTAISNRRPLLRYRAATLVTAVVAVLISACWGVTATAPPAAAGTTIRYRSWTYWHEAAGGWTFAATGPASYRPVDGAVEGWRYEVAAATDARPPATPPGFSTLCATTPVKAGELRVGVVLDYGTTADARSGQHPPAARGACAQAPVGSDAATLLATVATIRYRSDGLVCAFDSYPTTGCVDVVTAAAPTAPPTGSPAPTATRSSPVSPKPSAHHTAAPAPTPSARPTPTPTSPSPTLPAPPAPAPSTPVAPAPVRTTPAAANTSSAEPPVASASATPTAPTSASAPVAVAATTARSSAGGLVLTGNAHPTRHTAVLGALVGVALLVLLGGAAGLVAIRRSRSAP